MSEIKIGLLSDWYESDTPHTFDDFASFARHIEALPPEYKKDKRDTRAFSAAEYVHGFSRKIVYRREGRLISKDAYEELPSQEQSKWLKVEAKEKIVGVSVLGFDFDGPDKKGETEADYQKLLDALAGDSFVAYSTFSHRDVAATGRYKFRIVLELSRQITFGEHARLWPYISALFPLTCDSLAKDPTRLFGLPPKHCENDFVRRIEGKPIDVDEALKNAPEASSQSSQGLKPAVLEATLDPKDIKRLAKRWANSKNKRSQKHARWLECLIECKPYATGATGRHETARELTIALEQAFPEAQVEAIAELFRGSVVSMAADDPSWDPEVRMSDILRMIEGAREMRADAESGLEKVTDDARKVWIGKVRRDGKDTPYSAEEREHLAKIMNCAVLNLDKHWIVGRQGSYYFLTLRGLEGPVGGKDAHVKAHELLAPAGVSFYTIDLPVSRKLSISEMHDQYGRVASKIILDAAVPHSCFDAEEQVHEKIWPLLEDEPAFSNEVARYIYLVGAEHAEKLNDWIATIHLLDRPTCALYLDGVKDAGKSVLATLVSTLFNRKGIVVEMYRMLGEFNDALLQSPVVLADEELPKGMTSGAVRSMVASTSRQLNRKGLAIGEMHGALRVIVTANNSNLLNFGEDLGNDDIAAIGDRFLYLKVSAASSAYLESIGGRDHIGAQWIDGRAFARHAAWLRANRKVETGSRWLVKGDAGPLLTKMATQNGWRPKVCQWLCGYLTNPKSAAIDPHLARFDAAGFWVNAKIIERNWTAYVTDNQYNVINQTKAGTVLGLLSHPDPEGKHQLFDVPGVKQARFRRVNTDLLMKWAEQAEVYDVNQLRKNLESYIEAAKEQPLRKRAA